MTDAIPTDTELQALAERVAQSLQQRGQMLITAESCTGGWIAKTLTDIAGSSAWFEGGVVAYSYEAKEALLGVRHETLQQYGAVSRETVLEMARGARQALAGDFPLESIIGVSISGIAGPGGGLPGKPVGTVWFGLGTAECEHAWCFHWRGNRIQNKRTAARQALKLVIAYCKGTLPPDTAG